MNEISIVQNAGLGALVLWRFSESYSEKSLAPVPLPVFFLVLPMVFHKKLRDTISSTKRTSGLTKVLEKLASSKSKQADVIDGINARALELRSLTLRSLRVLLALNLAALDTTSATVLSSSKQMPEEMTDDVKQMLQAAMKLGEWFSRMTIYEIALALRVRF